MSEPRPTEQELEAGRKVFDRVVLLNGMLACDMLFEVEMETLVATILVAAEMEREEAAKLVTGRKKHEPAV